MHALSKHNINIPNKTLQTAIILPKDNDKPAESYPLIRDSLMHNPYGTAEYKAEEARMRKEAAKMLKRQQKETGGRDGGEGKKSKNNDKKKGAKK